MFNINPNKDVAKKARYVISNKVKNSIQFLLTECAKKTNIKSAKLKNAFKILEKTDYIPPRVHYFHHALQVAMRSQNVIESKITLLKLIHLISNNILIDQAFSISTTNNSDWERFAVMEAIRLANEDCRQLAEINPISGHELNIAKNNLHQAISLLEQYDANMVDEIMEQVRVIKVFDGKVTMGFTDVRILGAMFIRIPRPNLEPVLYFLEHIIHEASHIHLNCLMSVDPLILNSRNERFTSPLRSDARPMFGVFHATYVSAKIARTLMRLYSQTGKENLLHPLAETLDETLRGVVEIEKYAKLTQSGRQLVESINMLLQFSKEMPEWRHYDFSTMRTHRFGVGNTKVSTFERALA